MKTTKISQLQKYHARKTENKNLTQKEGNMILSKRHVKETFVA